MKGSRNVHDRKLDVFPKLEDLRLFLWICKAIGEEEKSLRKIAAELEDVTSPAGISQCLKRLEEGYGLKKDGLIKRPQSGDGCTLTQLGEMLHERARQLVAEHDKCREWTGIPGYERITLSIAPLLVLYALPQILEEFYTRRAGVAKVDFVIQEFENLKKALTELEEGRVAVVIGPTLTKEDRDSMLGLRNIRCINFRHKEEFFDLGRIVIIPKPETGEVDPFADLRRLKEVSLAALASYPVCCSEYYDSVILESLDEARTGRRVVVGTTEAQVRIIVKTRAFAGPCVPLTPLLDRWKAALTIRPIADQTELEVFRMGMYLAKTTTHSAEVQEFTDCAKKFFEEAIKNKEMNYVG